MGPGLGLVMSVAALGTVGPKAFAGRIGRNEAFNHAGNATAAAIAGLTAYFYGPVVVFWLLAAMAVASVGMFVAMMPETAPHAIPLRTGKTAVPRVG